MIRAEEIKGMVSYLSQLKRAIVLLQEQGAVALLNMSSGDRDGTINNSLWFSGKKNVTPGLPTLGISSEDYLAIQRSLQQGAKLLMELDVQTGFSIADQIAYNVIGEIPGTDPGLKKKRWL